MKIQIESSNYQNKSYPNVNEIENDKQQNDDNIIGDYTLAFHSVSKIKLLAFS